MASAQQQAVQVQVRELNEASQRFQELEKELQNHASARAALMTQQSENLGVQLELKELGEDAEIFKLLGPALIPQDREEANSDVSRRLEFIKGELVRVESAFQKTQQVAIEQQKAMMQLQARLQAYAAPPQQQ